MATIGPIVRNEVFFFVVILGAAALVVLREWFSARRPPQTTPMNPAERRMREWEFRRQRRWSFAAAILCVAGCAFARGGIRLRARDGTRPCRRSCWSAQNNQVRIPLSELTDSSLHFYTAETERHGDSFPGDSQDQRRLRHRARCLPDLRRLRDTARKGKMSFAAIAARPFTFPRSATRAVAIPSP